MRKFKRISAFLLALVMMLGVLTSCGGDKPAITPGTNEPADTTKAPADS